MNALPFVAPPAGRPQAAGPLARHQISVTRETDVPHAVAAVRRFCAEHGFTALFAAHVATAASELANNLWMHTRRGGQLGMGLLQRAGTPGVELVASDDGPGIADVALALCEGYSTAGGMGCGLPGVQRLMDEFDIRSSPAGTSVRSCKWANPRAAGPGQLDRARAAAR